MIDLEEFRRVMGNFGVSGPARESLLWLAQRINEHYSRERERIDKEIRGLRRIARGIVYK